MNEQRLQRLKQAIPVREPVVSSEKLEQLELKKIPSQWLLMSEAIKRQVESSQEVRNIVKHAVKLPVTEELPGQLIDKLADKDERVANLAGRYRHSLMEYLHIEAVPEKQLVPDIKVAPSLPNIDELVALWDKHKSDDEVEEMLKKLSEKGSFEKGITGDERIMAFLRFEMARDVKMMALGAELLDESISGSIGGNEFTLPSGVEIHLQSNNKDLLHTLLNPLTWNKRQQIKDRVYVIQAGDNGARFILKERKTSKHRDTMSRGHRPGLTSKDEVILASELDRHRVEDDELTVRWEEPIASVTFPDGFQFALFAYEEALEGSKKAMQNLTVQILERQDVYQGEFEKILSELDKDQQSSDVSSDKSGILRTIMGMLKKESPHLSYKDFAEVKAVFLQQKAGFLRDRALAQAGVTNRDVTDIAYFIRETDRDQPAHLEAVEFDLEYFREEKETTPFDAKKFFEGYEERDYALQYPYQYFGRDRVKSPIKLRAYKAMKKNDKDMSAP